MLDRFVYLFVADPVSFMWFFTIVTLAGLTCFDLVVSFVVFLFVFLFTVEFVVVQFLLITEADDLVVVRRRIGLEAVKVGGCDLQAVEQQSGFAIVDAAVEQGVQHLLHADLNGIAIFEQRKNDGAAGITAVATAMPRLVMPVAEIGVAQSRAFTQLAVGAHVSTGAR